MPLLRFYVLLGALMGVARTVDGQHPFRTDQRLLWTESRIHGTPDPPDPYQLEVAFPHLRFDSPIDLVLIPGTDRMAVVEHKKGISTFAANSTCPVADAMYDTSGHIELFAAAFHPRFTENPWAFFTYLDHGGIRLAKIRCSMADGVPRADPNSKQVIFTWPSGGHTGGCIRFGPDGYLYLGTGDGSDHSDTNQYAQNIGDPRGAILRLDVDHGSAERPYRIPPDNPFADHSGAIGEIFAYGLRQPWKFSFDSAGRLWAGDVGQDLWEMVYVITKGGNYGWSITEGSHPFRPERRPGPTPIVPPVAEHDHNQFRSITGGHVYESDRLAELKGAYIYGDFDTGRIWMLRYDGSTVTEQKQLTASRARVVGFGQDLQGEVYVVDYASGKILRLARQPVTQQQQADFPRRLSETGLFASTVEHKPATGLIPYSINAPNYADGAVVRRYLGLPGESMIEFDALLYPRGPGAVPGWRFPDGTVLMQTFFLALDATQPDRLQRLETRILHHQRMSGSDDTYGAQVWHGYTYIWNDEQTDAVLADAAGADRTFEIRGAAGQTEPLTWHFPNRTECSVCHNIAGKHVLGMNTMQMNRDHNYGGSVENQLAVFDRLGLFTDRLRQPVEELPRQADYNDTSEGVDDRARSYLHANCAHCHRQWGGGNASFQLMVNLPIGETNLIDTTPAHGAFGIANPRVIAPGLPCQSVLLYRMATIGPARMPRLGTSTVDPIGLNLVRDWIASMQPNAQTDLTFNVPESLSGAEQVVTSATLKHWLSDASRALCVIHAIDQQRITGKLRDQVIAQAQAIAEPHVLDLFERYVPENQRTKRLDSPVKPDAILSLPGDAQRGEKLFFESVSLRCSNCHQIKGQGTNLGPDLSQVGKQYDRYLLLDSIVNPSKNIKPEFTVVSVQTVDGRQLSGLRLPSSANEVVLKDAENKEVRVATDQVEQLVPQTVSLMPESLFRAMTAQQLSDLVEYLSGLK